MPKLLLIDGSNIMFRSFYGIRPFTTKDGLHTNAVYGTVTTLASELEDIKPDCAVSAYDLPTPTHRHEQFADYKGTRQKAPPELTEQIPYVRRAVESLGVRVLDLPGWEADDIIGTLAKRGEEAGYEVYILTGDRDALQLITEHTRVIFITNKGHILYDTAEFERNYGLLPPRLVDIKALMGDSSDNIPGVPGIGEKTALKLLAEAKTLDGVYENLDTLSVTPKMRERLAAGRDSAYLSYKLATIDRDAPVPVTLDELLYTGPDRDAMAALFPELEFHKLAERFGVTASSAAKAEKPAPAPDSLQIDADSLRALIAADVPPAIYLTDDTLYIKSETSIYKTPKDSPEAHELFAALPVVCHDYKSLYAAYAPDVRVRCAFDTQLAAYILHAGGSYELPRVAMTYLGENETPSRPEDTVTLISRIHKAQLAEFARIDAEATRDGQKNSSEVLYNIEIPLAPVLADMERLGFKIDTDGIRAYSDKLLAAETALAEQIYMRAGETFNINSPKQLGHILFEVLGLPAGKKTKLGYSTDADTLEGLRDRYEIVDDVLTYRQIAKLRSTYGEGLAAAADENGRIHTSFNQTVTATGRLSSTEPNLQNIPVRTELGRELRRFFIPCDADHVLVDADYSQIELRLLANISGDPVMSDAFLRGADIHASTASEVFKIPEESVTRELRARAKAVNFGIVYGIGDWSLSRDIGTTRKEAAEYIENYLSTYKGVDAYLKGTVAEAHERGYVTTTLGRRRYIPEIKDSNRQRRAFGERVAMNSPIQGTAADVIKLAMIGVARALSESGLDAHLILQVHDELIIECHRDCAAEVAELLRREMESAMDARAALPVPLSVDVKIGNSWYECK